MTDERRVLQLALGYWPARAFSAAGELGVYDLLARAGPLDVATIAQQLGIRSRSFGTLLDALVELDVLTRERGAYALAGGVPGPDVLALADAASMHAWADLPTVLRAGKRPGPSIYQELAGDPARIEAFAEVMARVSSPAHAAVAALDFDDGALVCDVGGADGRLAVAVASTHTGVRCISFDLPAFVPLVDARATEGRVADRVSGVGGDFFADRLPDADVLVLSLVLLDWDEAHKLQLLRSCRESLAPGGRVVIVERFEGTNGSEPHGAFDLLRSLHFLALLGEAHNFTAADLDRWLAETGLEVEHAEPVAGGLVLVVARGTTE